MAANSRGACSSADWSSYHAFLSFRGEDTRKGFTDHLYRALEFAGIHTFRDDDEIQRGSNIAAELEKAIQESRVSIIVLSKDYASSRWCLDELAKIMERRKTNHGHMVLPVFYHVDPSHVRKQTGSFADAFARHEECFKDEMDKVEKWRKALSDVANLGGMCLEDRYESQFIQDIVEEIGSKLNHAAINVVPYAVGIDYRVQGINRWLEDDSGDVGVAVIYGMGGIGKTTIAKSAYKMNLAKFQGNGCFLADISATSEQPHGLVRLQRNLLSDIQRVKVKKISNLDEGLFKIKHAVSCKKVLIVLDDVNHLDQFNAILGMREWFYPGSKVIVTTRHKHLLKAHDIYAVFEIEELSEDESLKLFSWHAFGQANPIESYLELSRVVVQHCGGLPLALQVLGSSLSGKSLDVWQSALQKLDVIPDGKIQNVLRISFDSLQDDHDKNLFLHIACFFMEQKKDFAITVLDNCNFYTRIGIQNLVDRCLLEINKENRLVMHQLLRDMGRGIIREENPDDPGKRSRVWHKDASHILRLLTGTEAIKGLMLNLPMLTEDEPSKTIFSRSDKKRCHVEDYNANCSKRPRLGFLSWKPIIFSSTNQVDFKTEAFRRMHNLEFILLKNVKIGGSFEDFPKKIIWLSWRAFPSESIPENFYLGNVVALDLRNSYLRCVWKGTMCLPRLKILNLSHSHGLMTTPNLSEVPNLEQLILKDCFNLVKVDDSIGYLEKLVFLNLNGCKSLKKLPAAISMLKSLQELNISGCSKLVFHPSTISAANNMNKLTPLSATLWESIWSYVSLKRYLPTIGFSLANLPHSLGRLSLDDCNLSEIPSDLSILSSLKYLSLRGNPILSLPENMKGFTTLQTLLLSRCTKLLTLSELPLGLKSLWMSGCTELVTLPELPPNLTRLGATDCTSLQKVTNLPNLLTFLEMHLFGSDKLVEVQSSFIMKPLGKVDIGMIKYMGLFNFETAESGKVEIYILNKLTNTIRKGPLQVLYECGIFSIFLHGSKVPDWFSYSSKANFVLCTIAPLHPNLKIQGLNVCVVYARRQEWGLEDGSCKYRQWVRGDHFNLIKVSNETKGLSWTYCPVALGIPKENEDILWLSHWRFENGELEGGDEVCVSVKMEDTMRGKEFGIQLVYEHENKDEGEGAGSNSEDVTIQQETPPWSHNVSAGDASASKYQMWNGKYFVCNHSLDHSYHPQFRMNKKNQAHLDFSYDPEGCFFKNHYLFKHIEFPQEDDDNCCVLPPERVRFYKRIKDKEGDDY